MTQVFLTVLPGSSGERTLNVESGATLQDLVIAQGLEGKVIMANSQTVEPTDFGKFLLTDNMEIYATQSVKGN